MKEKRNAVFSDVLFLVIILTLLLVSFLSYTRVGNLNNDFMWVNHSYNVKLKLEEILSRVNEAESAQRSFLITKDPAYLQPFDSSVTASGELLSQLTDLTDDNDSQQRKTRELQALILERIRLLRSGIQKFQTPGSGSPTSLEGGKQQMDKVRRQAKFIMQDEDQLLKERTRKRDQSVSITPQYTLILSLAAILIVVVAYFRMRMEKKLRFKAEDSEATIQNFFMQVPAMIAILKGKEHRFVFINSSFTELLGKSKLQGKTVKDFLKDIDAAHFYEPLKSVYETGQPFIGKEIQIPAGVYSNKENIYVNLVLQAYANTEGHTEGVLIFGYDVSEQVQTRRKIEEIEARSRLAIEAAQMGAFDWNLQTKEFISSPRLIEIFGFQNNSRVTHEDLQKRIHHEDKPVRDKAVEDSLKKGFLEYEARVVWADNSVHWINVFGKIIHGEKKEPLRMYGTVIDITRQKTILNELRESESKFRLLADSMPQLIWTGDASGQLNYFNKAVYEFTGANIIEPNGDGWINNTHPDEKAEHSRKWEDSTARGTEFRIEHRIKNHAGEYRWFLSRAIPQRGLDQKINMWVGTSTDIDEQKNFSVKLQENINQRTFELARLNKELLLKNNIFAQAEANAKIGSYAWSLQTGALEYSDNLFRLLGHEPGDFIPSFEKYLTFIHPDDLEQVIRDGNETYETKKLVEHVHRVVSKDGTVKYFRSSGQVFGEGENTTMIGTVQDVSYDTLLNEKLKAQNVELERSNAELESFNYVASHDLQEPLRKIQAFSQRILEKEKDHFSPLSADYFERITNAAKRMQNLIDALISYSRTNITDTSFVFTDLNKLLTTVKESLEDSIEESNARIESIDSLPVAKVIPVQFQQLFINIISNAIKYSKKGTSPHITITSSVISGKELQEPGANLLINYIRISFADDGIGFEEQYKHKIFELFQRLHVSSEYLGTGIGLAICSKIMRNHEGYITASGQPGVGAVFNVYLPVKEI